MKRLLLISGTGLLLSCVLLAIVAYWLLLTVSGARWGLEYLSTALDRQLTYTGVDGTLSGPIAFGNLDYRQGDLHITATDVHLTWKPAALLNRRLVVTSLDVGTLTISVPVTRSEQNGSMSPTIPDIQLPLDLSLDKITINNINVINQQQQYAVRHLFFSASSRSRLITIKRLDLDSDILSLKLSGTLRTQKNLPHKLTIDWRYRATADSRISGRGSLVGNLADTRLRQQLTSPLALSVRADLHDLLESPRGDIQLSHDKQRLHAQLHGPTATQPLTLTFDWQYLAWPFDSTPLVASDSGSGWLTGKPDGYELGLAASLHSQQFEGTLFAAGRGDTGSLQLSALHIESDAGTAEATARINLSPTLHWSSNITLANLNPGHWQPEWSGNIGGTMSAQGSIDNGRNAARIDITRLHGTIRDYPVTLRGQLEWRDEILFLNSVELSSAASRIDVHGRISDSLSLDWRLDSPDLAELLPDAGGKLQLDGRLSGRRDAPRIEAHASGQALNLATLSISKIDGTVDMSLQQPWQTLGNIRIENLQWKDRSVRNLALNSDGQHLTLTASADEGDIDLVMDGKADASGWQGRITQADIHSQIIKDWQLESATNIHIDGLSSITLSPLCWHGLDNGRLCMSLSRQDHDWQATLDGAEIPLALMDVFLPEDVHIDARATLSAELQTRASMIFGQARVQLSAGQINFPVYSGEHSEWNFQTGRLDINLDEQGLRANTELAINDTDHVDASLELPDIRLLKIDASQQRVGGTARLTSAELGIIDLLVPDIHVTDGRLAADLTLAGTLADPRFDGHISVDNGAVQVPRLGLMIQPVRIQGQTDLINQFSFNADADSSDGHLHITGHTDLAPHNGWPTTLHLSGESVEVSHIPEARILASPDMDIRLDDHDVILKGKILIPYARLQQKTISSTAQVSEDAVIVNAENPPEPKWRLSADVHVTLGDQVTYSGFGFDGRMTGGVTLKTEPGQLATALGELSVAEGRYLAYRQRLDIERGRLIYTGGPLTNPGLDLRAVRHIESVTAGLKVHGSLTRPQLELFSEPGMDQNDILAYLLLGHPLESSTGEEGALLANAALSLGIGGGNQLAQSIERFFDLDELRIESNDTGDQYSVVIGKHLSPRLYISYGVGQVEVLNTFNIRYRISDKWQLTAENGEHEGADLLYTIER